MTTTPLPPHVISTDHPNHPSEGWSIAEMVWIDARDKIFQAYARQARADLEAENKRLREALKSLVDSIPTSLRCEDFHHPSRDRHGIGGHCGPKARYVTALNSAIATLENTK